MSCFVNQSVSLNRCEVMKERIEQKEKMRKLLYEFRRKYRLHPELGEIINLFRIMDMEPNNAIATARIALRENRLHVEVSPMFFNQYMQTPDDIGFVICHEILHYVLGHLTIEGREAVRMAGNMQANLAMDIVINHRLYKIFLNPEKLFVQKFYENSQCPVEMLKPPSTIDRRKLRYRPCKNFYKAWNLRSDLLLELVLSHIEWHSPPPYLRIGEFIVENGELPPGFLKKLIELLKRFGIRAHGSGGELRTERVKKRRYNAGEKIFRKIREMLTEDANSTINLPFHGNGVLPFLGRTDFVFLPIEVFIPLFHANPALEPLEMGVRIYVDVSGSTQAELPFVLALIEDLKDIIAFPVYCLSTIVRPVVKDELFERTVFTTGGTDYNAFAKHLLKSGYKKAIFITDGYADIDPCLASSLRQKSQVLTILTTDYEEVVRRFSRDVLILEGFWVNFSDIILK